jgi:DeoR family L-fucose operon activator
MAQGLEIWQHSRRKNCAERVMKQTRHQQILQLLAGRGGMSTGALAQALGVSMETLRRDLRALQSEGKVLRSHGRARSLLAGAGPADSFSARRRCRRAHKADVARQALAWIDVGMTIALDASSTSWQLARLLANMPVTVVTNSLRICRALEKRERIRLINTGGWLDRNSASYENPALPTLLRQLDIDLFIFSCQGVDGEGGIWDEQTWNARFKTLLLARASQSLLLLDKSKQGRTGEIKIGSLGQVTVLVAQTS